VLVLLIGECPAVDLVGAGDHHGFRSGQGADQVGGLGAGVLLEDEHVGVLDLRAGDLAEAAFVVGVRVQPPVHEQVVAEQVVDQSGRPEGRHDAGQAQAAGQPGVAGQDVAQLVGLGPDGKARDDRVPPRVASHALQRGQDVLAQGAADAGVLQRDLGTLHHTGRVADDPRQDLRDRVDPVAYGDGPGEVPRQAHHGAVHGVAVHTGHDDQRGPHDVSP